MLAKEHQDRLNRLTSPTVGIHIRRGDFRELNPGEDFARTGLTRTPLAYSDAMTKGIRHIHDTQLPVTIFTDGRENELAELLALPKVRLADPNPAIVDMLLLSKSQLIVPSAGSIFGYWSAFLADAPVLLHPDHIHMPIRADAVNSHHFEGGVSGPSREWPDLLQQNIKAIG